MYLYLEFENGGYLCTDHASVEDWESFAGQIVMFTEWRTRGFEVDWDSFESACQKDGDCF